MAALPHGQAVVHVSNNDTVVRMENFQIIRELYKNTVSGKAFHVTGLHVQGSNLFVLHYNGTIVQMQLENGNILKIYNIGISGVRNYGSANTDLCDINKEIVLLTSHSHNKVYSYNISSQTKKARVNKLNIPRPVICNPWLC